MTHERQLKYHWGRTWPDDKMEACRQLEAAYGAEKAKRA